MCNRNVGAISSHTLRPLGGLPMKEENRLSGAKVLDLYIDPAYPTGPSGPQRFEYRLLDGESSGKILNPVPPRLFQLSRVIDPSQKSIPEPVDTLSDPGNVNQIDPDTEDHVYLWLRLSIRSAKSPIAAIWNEVINVIVTEASMIFSVQKAL